MKPIHFSPTLTEHNYTEWSKKSDNAVLILR